MTLILTILICIINFYISFVECSLSGKSVLIQHHSSPVRIHEKEKFQYASIVPNVSLHDTNESSNKNCNKDYLPNPVEEYVDHTTCSNQECMALSEFNASNDINEKFRRWNRSSSIMRNPKMSAVMYVLSSMVSTYKRNLELHPLYSNIISAGVIGAIGDILSQYYENILRSKHQHGATSLYDFRRNLGVFLEGILISGPVLHYSFKLYELIFPVKSSNDRIRNIMAAAQVIVDSVIMDPFHVLSAMVTVGLFEGFSFSKVLIPQLKKDYIPSVKIAWISSLLLSPFQYFTVRYLPLKWRVISISVQSTIWDAIIMFMAHKGRR